MEQASSTKIIVMIWSGFSSKNRRESEAVERNDIDIATPRGQHEPRNYKICCYHGETEIIQVMSDPSKGGYNLNCYDLEWDWNFH